MTKRLLVGLLLLASCGRQVDIDHTALKQASELKAGSEKSLQSGVVNKLKSGNTYLVYGTNSYSISETSSYLSKTFIEKLPVGETKVHFKGKVTEGKIALSEITIR